MAGLMVGSKFTFHVSTWLQVVYKIVFSKFDKIKIMKYRHSLCSSRSCVLGIIRGIIYHES